MIQEDTIAAISTAPGEAGIGVIRISGPEALGLSLPLFMAGNEQPGASPVPRRMVYGRIVDPATREMVDEVLYCYMKAPYTYTREDVVEIQCHGGSQSLQRIMALLLARGVRPAEPGEFTKRAFLNGRLDLSQAEAVMDLIRAKTRQGHQAAATQLEGALSRKVHQLRTRLMETMATMEVAIDFSEEEDVDDVTAESLVTIFDTLLSELERLIESARTGRIYREGVKTVIVGKPNVGKSSLMNALLRESRSIVTDIPGTTRDAIEEQLNLRGIPVVLMDTAGIRETDDLVERLGVEKTHQFFDRADLVLVMLDASVPLTEEDRFILEMIREKKALVIINKTDLPARLTEEQLPEWIAKDQLLRISLLEAQDVLLLEEALTHLIFERELGETRGEMVTNLRHQLALEAAREALKDGKHALEQQMPLDFVQVDVQTAMDHLGEIVGEVVREDLVDYIFSHFCIGK